MLFLFLLLIGIPAVAAQGWDDFSNNLATDLAPFLSLFGEQVTKQYLSESTTFLDYFIFAMAPMGIITALVSMIRVCGSPALRAFIGRAQEGSGEAEAELCSSTGRDVCEVYHNGGIARVFGRPKILEVIYNPDYLGYDSGIYTFQEYTAVSQEWCAGDKDTDQEKLLNSVGIPNEAFAPNLSLNIGIKKRHPAVYWTVAVCGFVLQTGILVLAGVITYYLEWGSNGNSPEPYACPLAIAGTILVGCGMFLCAFLIGQSTAEQVWRRPRGVYKASMHWVQPGGQTIGDQTFNAFAYSDNDRPNEALREYTISWKKEVPRDIEYVVWLTIVVTISGFVLQFTGLRGVHSAVSVAQLGVVLVMGLARAALRMQRLAADANALAGHGDTILGHELDWFALRLGRDYTQQYLGGPHGSESNPPGQVFWMFRSSQGLITDPPSADMLDPKEANIAVKLLALRVRLAKLTQSPFSSARSAVSAAAFDLDMVGGRREAQNLASAIESAINAVAAEGGVLRGIWHRVDEVFWKIQSRVAVIESRPALVPILGSEYPIFLQLTRNSQYENIPWHLDNRLKIEAILGLWLWALKYEERILGYDEEVNGRIPNLRLVCKREDYERTETTLWSSGPSFSADGYSVDSKTLERAGPGAVWLRGSWRELILAAPSLENQSRDVPIAGRLFGRYAVQTTGAVGEMKIHVHESSSSLSSLCAQEAFGSFLTSIFSILQDVGRVDIQEDTDRFLLKNRLVSALVDVFTDHHLGSERDALLCILPVVLPRLRRSSLTCAVDAATESAHQHRRQGRWKEARKVLDWLFDEATMYFSSNPDHIKLTNRTLIAMGELFRYALREPASQEFGIDGFRWFSVSDEDPAFGALRDRTTVDIIDRYVHLWLRFPFLQQPGDAEESANDLWDNLFSAIEKDNRQDALVVLTRLQQGLPITQVPTDALWLAAQRDWHEVVRALLELGVNPEQPGLGLTAGTALTHATQNGSVDSVRELLHWGADPEALNESSWKPIQIAAEGGHTLIVKMLLKSFSRWLNPRPLFLALANGRDSTVNLLLEETAKENSYSGTPLHEAVSENNELFVEALIDRGLDIESTDGKECTPLQLAADLGYETIVKVLLDRGAGINVKSGQHYKTALHVAAARGHCGVVRLLLDRGADPFITSMGDLTALDLAKEARNEEIVAMLTCIHG
ncbi:hypothetical protein BDW68DRAFT_162964 [Aspergillus falconensis]